jgi:threonyl-tRNA synthetase
MTKRKNMTQEELEIMRHSFAHVLMQALEKMYGAIPAVGPVIENGFYHDFDCNYQVKEEDLPKIEKTMKKIIKDNLAIEKEVMSIDDAIKTLQEKKYIYTAELAEDLKKEGETEVSFYRQGDFMNMCRGPHCATTRDLNQNAFKLTKVAGAYWKGDENNKMIQRIYGVAFASPEELEKYLELLEEAKKRDHRKLGKELDLFCFSDLVGPGLPMFTPKGVVLIDELKKHIEGVCRKYGFEKVMTPHLSKIDLFETSGHAQKFSEELFRVTSGQGHDFALKPVQCPHQTQIYASRPRSYRELPIRYMESEKQYRAEQSGEVGGLSRVYAITVEDGHTFCRVDQVKEEIKNLVNIIKDFYTALGLWDNHWVSLSVRDYDHPEKYIGNDKDWDDCERILEEVADEMGLDAKRCEGEAALYGPKLDFMFKDALGKEIQIPTVQVDFATPKRFELSYTNQEGKDEYPVMVHRAILGSYERFLVLLIEHFAGAFPLWLSPVQVKIISVGEGHIEHCKKLADEFRAQDIRVEIDDHNETVGNKIRKTIKEKVPYMLVIGDKEMNSDKLNIRDRGSDKVREISKEDFFNEVADKVKNKK